MARQTRFTRMRLLVVAILSALLLPVLAQSWAKVRAAARPGVRVPLPAALPPLHTPSQAACLDGWRHWKRSLQVANRRREALEAWDPHGMAEVDPEQWRQQQALGDPGGHLQRARSAGRRALAMAQTRDDTYQAALLLARIECDTGHHEEELRQARRLVALKPRERVSLTCLERAARCNRLVPLQQRAARAIDALSTPRVAYPHTAERKVSP